MQNKSKSPPGLIIAGTHSSVGKSSLAIGLMHLLKRKGYKVVSIPTKIRPRKKGKSKASGKDYAFFSCENWKNEGDKKCEHTENYR